MGVWCIFLLLSSSAVALEYNLRSCQNLVPVQNSLPSVPGSVGSFNPNQPPGFNPNPLPPGFNPNPLPPGFNQPPNFNLNQRPGFNPNQQLPNFGPGIPGSNGQPILVTSFNPFQLAVSSNRYKKNRVLEVRLQGQDFFDAFMIEARALGGGPSNIAPSAGVGRWVGFPAGVTLLNCYGRQSSAVASIGSYVSSNFLNFTWEAPEVDMGDIYFVAGVAQKERYWMVTSDRVLYHRSPYPGEITGCGSTRTCVRLCEEDPLCSLDDAVYVLIIEIGPMGREAIFTLGGRVQEEVMNGITTQNTYIAFGMTESYYSVEDMDMSVCMKEHGQVMLGHYYVKSETAPPFPHIGVIVPDATDVDEDFIWCRFRRPLLKFGDNSIDPSRSMYHYYFKGPKNVTGIYLPDISEMNISPDVRNISEFYNDVQISNGVEERLGKMNLVYFACLFVYRYFS